MVATVERSTEEGGREGGREGARKGYFPSQYIWTQIPFFIKITVCIISILVGSYLETKVVIGGWRGMGDHRAG